MRWRTVEKATLSKTGRGLRAAPAIAGGGIGTIVLLLVAIFLASIQRAASERTTSQRSLQTVSRRARGSGRHARIYLVVLADTEDMHDLSRRMGSAYEEPKLVLLNCAVESACGFAWAAVGPFYCPADQKVYIDLVFYQGQIRFHAPGDFAQA